MHRALWKSAPCLAAGNTMVYKPSEFTPLHANLLARLYTSAGLPAGVFNVVQGDGRVGAALVAHPDIAKVSFTGQVSTGQKVASTAARDMKAITMELGGKSPLIILPDCGVEDAVDGAMLANFYSSGQVCTNGTRVFVPGGMKSAFERRLLEKLRDGRSVRAGDPLDPNTNFGPLSGATHREKVVGYIEHGISVDRATLLYGSRSPATERPAFFSTLDERFHAGSWLAPTVFTDCTDEMRIVREEIFGPVMTILAYEDGNEEEVVRRANDTSLGLAAGVFTRDLNAAHRIVDQLQAGITWVNTWGESPAEMSVGGWKMSGVGVENGRAGIEAWVRRRSTLVEGSGKVPTVF